MRESNATQYDRAYWEDRADPHMLSMVYEIYDDLGDILKGYTLNYTSTYIGIQKMVQHAPLSISAHRKHAFGFMW